MVLRFLTQDLVLGVSNPPNRLQNSKSGIQTPVQLLFFGANLSEASMLSLVEACG